MYKGLTFYNHNASIPYLQPRHTFMVLAVLDKYEFERIAETHEDVVHSMFWRMKHVLNIASVPPLAHSKILQIFGGLVLGCIKTKFCKKICVRQHFSSSTRFASFCTAAISKFSQKIGLKKQRFS